jgi:hypothetical protein
MIVYMYVCICMYICMYVHRCDPWLAAMTSSWAWLLPILSVMGTLFRYPKLMSLLTIAGKRVGGQRQTLSSTPTIAPHIVNLAMSSGSGSSTRSVMASGEEARRTQAANVLSGVPLIQFREQAIAREQPTAGDVRKALSVVPPQVVEPIDQQDTPVAGQPRGFKAVRVCLLFVCSAHPFACASLIFSPLCWHCFVVLVVAYRSEYS